MINLTGKSVFVKTQEEYLSVLKIARLQGFTWARGNHLNPIKIPFPNILKFYDNKNATYRDAERTLYEASEIVEDEEKIKDAVKLVRAFAKNQDRTALTESFIKSLKLLANTVESQMEEVKQMKITAIAREDLSNIYGGLVPNEIKLELSGQIAPDSYGEQIGYYDVEKKSYVSYFKKDKEEGNTDCFDTYKNSGCVKEKRHEIYTERDIKEVIDYYLMYDIKESSRNEPTETEDYISRGIYINGYHKCRYELLFAADGMTSRVVVEYKTNNVPMYDFIKGMEDDISEILEDDSCEDNIFYGIIKNHEIMMFDEFARGNNVEIENADDLTEMLASVRMLSCEFVENGSK